MTSENPSSERKLQDLTAAERLKRAQDAHAAGRIDEALAEARAALASSPGYVPAMTYLGTTLITRRFAFAEGLQVLEAAVVEAPEDAGAWYSLGWCQEFVAYRLSKLATTPYRDPYALWAEAAESLRRCIALEPEPGLKEDAEDLLESIEPRLE